jgi:anti-sigma factor RsiW
MTTAESSERQEAARQQIEELLPWHAAGTLSRRDAQRVDDALARDPELARRYELVREELGETVHLNETLGAPSARALDKLMTAIDAEPARARSGALGFAARLTEFFAGLSPPTLAWSGAAAAVVIILQAGVIAGVVLNDRAAPYQTATAPANAAGAFVAIRFNAQATANDITQFLTEHKLSIVGGPLAGGMFRVKLADTTLSKDELARIVKRLQDDKRVEMIATTQ